MIDDNNKISVRQLQALLILGIFGTGVAALPRQTAEYAGQDGWIPLIIAVIAALISISLICGIASKFPDKSFVEYTSQILSYPIGVILSVFFIIKLTLNTALELRMFCEIVKQGMLNKTPFAVVSAVMLLLGAYAASKGYETRGRLAEVLIFFAFAPLIIVFGIAAFDVDYTNLLPIFTASPTDVLKGGAYAFYAFSGIELAFLVYPYINRPAGVKKGAVKAICVVGFLMLLITVITIARFGPFDLQRQMWPVIQIMDAVYIPGAFIERQDALIMSFWIISVFMKVNAGLFFISILCRDTFKRGKRRTYVLIAIPAILILSLWPENVIKTFKYMQLTNLTLGTVFMLAVPLILLAVYKLRRLGEAK